MLNQLYIRSYFLVLVFLILIIIFVFQRQEKDLNWSIFYSSLWTSISLAIVNYICVKYNLWQFLENNTLIINIPLDLYFIWIVIWGILPVYLFKGKHTIILCLSLLSIDLILMPELHKLGVLKLNENWLIGETALILIVFIPSHLWAKFYYNKTSLKIRSLLQVLTMSLLLLIGIPFIVKTYTENQFILPEFNIYLFQIILIIAFPSLMAVIDLTRIGKGTPFPYDKTKNLVRSGVYAYCKNPIQWSFTLLFVPLSIFYNSLLLLTGSIISIAYTIGISNPQEYQDMKERYNEDWLKYKKSVPSWWFLWQPKSIPTATIYFRQNCNQCEQIRLWFIKRKPSNLNIEYSKTYKNNELFQVTYVDSLNNKYESIHAFANALEHINLAYACLGWFMRFPIIRPFLQLIINTMDFDKNEKECTIKQ